MRRPRFAVFAAALLAAPLASAQVKLQNAWLRPAAAGQAAAMVYVDIESSRPLKLVGARSPVAKGARLVVVDAPGPEAAQKVVDAIDVAANETLRLAYLGSHVRLVGIGKDLTPGTAVPLELEFVDASGQRSSASVDAMVRGIAARPPANAAAPEPAKAN